MINLAMTHSSCAPLPFTRHSLRYDGLIFFYVRPLYPEPAIGRSNARRFEWSQPLTRSIFTPSGAAVISSRYRTRSFFDTWPSPSISTSVKATAQ